MSWLLLFFFQIRACTWCALPVAWNSAMIRTTCRRRHSGSCSGWNATGSTSDAGLPDSAAPVTPTFDLTASRTNWNWIDVICCSPVDSCAHARLQPIHHGHHQRGQSAREHGPQAAAGVWWDAQQQPDAQGVHDGRPGRGTGSARIPQLAQKGSGEDAEAGRRRCSGSPALLHLWDFKWKIREPRAFWGISPLI